jgi:hypothetical protein
LSNGEERDAYDEDTGVHDVTIDPILNDESSGGQLIGRDDDVFEPVSRKEANC